MGNVKIPAHSSAELNLELNQKSVTTLRGLQEKSRSGFLFHLCCMCQSRWIILPAVIPSSRRLGLCDGYLTSPVKWKFCQQYWHFLADKHPHGIISTVTGVFVSAMTILPASPADRTFITWKQNFSMKVSFQLAPLCNNSTSTTFFVSCCSLPVDGQLQSSGLQR